MSSPLLSSSKQRSPISLLTAKELHQLVQSDKPPKILDASWHMPNSGRKGFAEFKEKRIPGSAFFDLDIIAADKDERGLAHMLPDGQRFADACTRLGISRDDHVVVLDSVGVFSSPRAAWTFKAFGHEKVSLLNGGLPAWTASSLPLDTSLPVPPNPHDSSPDAEKHFGPIMSVLMYDKRPRVESYFIADIEDRFGDYPAAEAEEGVTRSYEDVVKNAKKGEKGEVVLDARSAGRFKGTDPEPREGLSSGHIPNSHSIPFNSLLSSSDGYTTYLPPDELEKVFKNALGDKTWEAVKKGKKGVVTTCGSGMTAAVVGLGLELAGRKEGWGLYDESWTGYAARPESKIVKD